MEYGKILNRQSENMRRDLNWWPRFFYHFTDVHNVINILGEGWIYSREQAQKHGWMKNDNASRTVIAATKSSNKIYGRLYFRPLTPTQYHNEGYKPEAVRRKEFNASCPVPVFLCLDAVATLNYPGTKFAPKGLAGMRHDIQEGKENFNNLEFEKIYHDGPYAASESDIKDYRHSEVIRENGFPVEPLLRCILCRTIAEKETLLYLIKRYSLRMYNTYKKRVLYRPGLKCFYKNGIFVKRVSINAGVLNVELNDPEERFGKEENNVPFQARVELTYMHRNGEVLLFDSGEAVFEYTTIRSFCMNLDQELSYDLVRVKVLFDNIEMYENEFPVGEKELY